MRVCAELKCWSNEMCDIGTDVIHTDGKEKTVIFHFVAVLLVTNQEKRGLQIV